MDELPHLYALTDIVVTRAGAGVLAEIAALEKAAIVIPLCGLTNDHVRGLTADHQWQNAVLLADRGAVEILAQEQLETLTQVIGSLLANRGRMQSLGRKLHECFPEGADRRIAEILRKTAHMQRGPSISL